MGGVRHSVACPREAESPLSRETCKPGGGGEGSGRPLETTSGCSKHCFINIDREGTLSGAQGLLLAQFLGGHS